MHNRGDLIPFVAAVEHHDPLEAAVCLSEGADDYISTATEVIELVARIQSVIKRATAKQVSAKERVMTLGSLCLDQVQHRVFVASQEVSITPKAFALLRHFMLHPNKIFSREQLLDALWGWDKEFNDRVVDVRVWELRKLLSSDSSGINYIETVVGVGYRFVSDRDDVST
ncbi:MAG: response regulator transcription factor [Chloroflexi bacterium]|uniref:winged helix-turn-helix domain-containing protein n=1 Tax=Candidatus Flexifilum breve TaxID=3140694 RepID=UPI003136EAA8|nr:response regulator transcription factor [Chloroflexota bacterium]